MTTSSRTKKSPAKKAVKKVAKKTAVKKLGTKKVAIKKSAAKKVVTKSAVKPVKTKNSDFKLTAKLKNIKYDPKTTVLSATAVVKLDTPIGGLTLFEDKVSAKVPLNKEVVLFKTKAKGSNYDIDVVGKVKLKTIKAGTLSVTAAGKVVVGISIPVKASYGYDFTL